MIRARCHPQHSTKCRRPGAATVELALVAPLFLLMLAGIIEFGQAFRLEHALSNAARRGARAAIVDGATTSQVTEKVKTHCASLLGVSKDHLKVTVSLKGQVGADVSTAAAGDEITVTVSIPYSKVGVGFYTNLFSGKSLSSSCTLESE
jgi:Flp pilus assembly protein TadG